MSNFKLSATLEGHEQDVKALVSPFNDTIVSASRDSTVKVWTKNNGVWSSKVNFTSTGFVNALTFDAKENLVISGGQDKLINITDLFSSGVDAKYVLIGHESNVCSLDASDDEIISGSWDSTAKVWENNQEKYTLSGHNASVWDVKILGGNRYLTSSADRTVKLWEGSKEIKSFIGHSDVVRGLALLPDGSGFASTSNDGTVRISDFEGNLIRTLVGHESFVYSIKFLSNGDIVTSGEDRTVRIWRNGQAIQVITLPSISVWTVSVLPNDDIVTGGSDSVVRIFTRDETRFASKEEIEEFQKSVQGSSINSQTVDDSKTVGPEALDLPGNKEGQVIMVKTLQGIVEAHQWSEGKWNKIGEVVGASSSDKKKVHNGEKWDFVFDVDVKDGAPPLKLPYNSNENPYTAATRFLEANELPTSYTEEVVNFITSNTQGVNINQASDVHNPYVDQKVKVVPHTEYLGFTSNNAGPLFKGIQKFNLDEKTFSDDQLSKIEKSLSSNDLKFLLSVATTIIDSWKKPLPGYDLLRLIISKIGNPAPSTLNDVINKGLNTSDPAIYFMTLRLLSNVFSNKTWGETLATDSKTISTVVNHVAFDITSEPKHTVNISNALSTVLLNYSVYASKYKSTNVAEKIVKVVKEASSKITSVSSEAAYRLSISYGNLIYTKRNLKNSEFEQFKKVILNSHTEQRFLDALSDIEEL
ncbi:hypothetical protein BN7_6526 [Wickerhamomyces ciferrii]|uniref:Phospholipase A-2-activating protein n=1 Tax=Wickerhamomyces ciferrii (strain ATCC 14091 / BCRC 22168 / CBS 111 / JCM 3599 / NBRC 0793 / NRRL Y-1031 F-60-10) TaxID=1206466 RepID=K0KNR9_WICCF|nr:uncharacterized protein BN7_6526 [Wickerhamomyces ciferrii]CCH46920.1 hypothetical protein BN7_6526 [Wickerhamomyces ciferrii]